VKKIIIIGFILCFIASVLYFYWKKQQFVVLVNEDPAFSADLDTSIVTAFLKKNLPPESKIVISNNNGQITSTETLKKIKIILTSEPQNLFSLRYKPTEKPVTSSGLKISENTLEIYVQIDKNALKEMNDDDWFLSTNIAQTTFYIRDLSKKPNDQTKELRDYYRTHFWTPEVYSSIEELGMFGKVEKK